MLLHWFSIFGRVALCCILSTLTSYAQKNGAKVLEQHVASAVDKAYQASVRIWGFDTVRNERTSAQFSGVVVTSEGYILTAAHVIQPGKSYKVFFPDGKNVIAVALGRIDVKETPGIPDVGMMKIKGNGKWPYAAMGFSSSLKNGEACLSISYPESLNQELPTIRFGKILDVKNQYGFVQSSCKMEPGDSGGPLFDLDGKVVAIHSAIDVSEDMNFEIPVDIYRKYWSALQLEKNYTALPAIVDIDSSTEKSPHLSPNEKYAFNELSTEQNAKRAFLVVNSFIDGEKVEVSASVFNLRKNLGKPVQVLVSKSSMIGDSAHLVYEGKLYNLNILARDQTNDLVMLATTKHFKHGVKLDSNYHVDTPKLKGKFVFTKQADGKVVASIIGSEEITLPKIMSQPLLGAMVVYESSPAVFSLIKQKSPAEALGLEVGDELVSFGGHELKSSKEFVAAVSQYWPADEVLISWKRKEKLYKGAVTFAWQAQSVSKHPVDRFAGGKSKRRDGFDAVYTHDLALLPQQIGTSVYDLEGNFVGINIARFSRTSTLIMPSYKIAAFIYQYKFKTHS
ncbi:trypsin-like peptidase domain-containing protein [Pedobacter sp. MC2016-05]|uniref:trypsin-like peptidase domain-containing protein n=1 Tax=Pedobacter sp. MC2016-05 TaxID=2994474 RepID=UPI00224732C7|nr:trypsin-like peptidase domain-containing protein [Pedobacter sp. MC2016-05]MCX2476852.1 trypsin-like peptidase domain-containing protein [Pedobacter sp. MC2016-05]